MFKAMQKCTVSPQPFARFDRRACNNFTLTKLETMKGTLHYILHHNKFMTMSVLIEKIHASTLRKWEVTIQSMGKRN